MKTSIYAIKGDPGGYDILSSLEKGIGRFGWSYISTANLTELQARIDRSGWDSLSKDEKKCYHGFLLELKEDDYVVYVNVPEWGRCTLARVTGQYEWRFEDEDFNHRFAVDRDSIASFDRNDEIVHPALSARLKLQGRWWRIYVQDEFYQLVQDLAQGRGGETRSVQSSVALLAKEIEPSLRRITEAIHHTHPNFDFEALLEEVFKNVPGVQDVDRKRGLADKGADLIVRLESGFPIPGLLQQQTLLVQAKSYEGRHWDTRAIDDMRRALDHFPEAHAGLIISTATGRTENLDEALEKLQNDVEKPVAILIGGDVARFVLRFSPALL